MPVCETCAQYTLPPAPVFSVEGDLFPEGV